MFSRRFLGVFAALAVLCSGLALTPAAALAGGASAADSQYQDPLAGTAKGGPQTVHSAGTKLPIRDVPSRGATTSDTALDVELAALAALILIGGGFVLRRRVAR